MIRLLASRSAIVFSRPAYSSAAGGVVNRAGADDDDQPGIDAGDDVGDGRARVGDDDRGALADRDLFEQDRRRNQRPDVADAKIVGASKHDVCRRVTGNNTR